MLEACAQSPRSSKAKRWIGSDNEMETRLEPLLPMGILSKCSAFCHWSIP